MASIYKRKNRGGVYYLKVRIGGRWKWISLRTRDKRQALAEKRAVEDRLRRGDRPPEEFSMRDLETLYLEWLREHRSTETIRRRERTFRRWLDLIGDRLVSSISPNDVDRFRRAYKDAAVSEKSTFANPAERPGDAGSVAANDAITGLKAAINVAKKQRWYSGPNPFENVERYRLPSKHVEWLEIDQIAALLEAAELHSTDMLLVVALGVFAGLRPGESLAARWTWVDFDAGLLHVRSGAGWVQKDREDRTVPLHSNLRRILEPLRRPGGYLIAPDKPPGKWRNRYEYRKSFNAIRSAAGVPWCTPKTLRHTFASQLVSAGVDLYKVSTWMGHGDVRTTTIYAHLRPADPDIDAFMNKP